jgi:hypothetical protein
MAVTRYSYIIASTLNQVVNLIPLLDTLPGVELDTVIYNLTLVDDKGVKLEENAKWDAYLKDMLQEKFPGKHTIADVEIKQSILHNSVSIADEITGALNGNSNPIFWNITGGQRYYLFAVDKVVAKFANPSNRVFYLDGNYGLYYWIYGNSIKKRYEISKLKIHEALTLMGFFRNVKVKTVDIGYNAERIDQICQKYLNNEPLREALIGSNKNKIEFKDRLTKVYSHLGDIELEKYVETNYASKSYPFGYLLEDMVHRRISKNLGDDILEVTHSAKLAKPDLTGSHKIVDEFDILVMTKSGQLINFECKSGMMSGDVAKSTQYSTYRIGGVYGLPILITPLTKVELASLGKLIANDLYLAILSAISAARNAGMDVWGIDEITTRLEEKIKSTK